MTSYARIPARQGDTIELLVGPVKVRDPITQALTPIDLTLGGTEIRFTAKAAISDADAGAVIRKTSGVAGGPGGITPDSPASAGKNIALVTIQPSETDALTTLPATLVFDVQLLEPSGRKSTIAEGDLVIVADVTNA